jgi:hypothetical protein
MGRSNLFTRHGHGAHRAFRRYTPPNCAGFHHEVEPRRRGIADKPPQFEHRCYSSTLYWIVEVVQAFGQILSSVIYTCVLADGCSSEKVRSPSGRPTELLTVVILLKLEQKTNLTSVRLEVQTPFQTLGFA